MILSSNVLIKYSNNKFTDTAKISFIRNNIYCREPISKNSNFIKDIILLTSVKQFGNKNVNNIHTEKYTVMDDHN